MKLTNVFNLTMVLGLALAVGATGCKKKPIAVTNLPPGAPTRPVDTPIAELHPAPPIPQPEFPGSQPGGQPFDPTKGAGTLPPTPGRIGWHEDPGALKGATIHFDFDKSSVRSSEHHKIIEVANYLKNNPTAAVRVEGNCDERGTEEYNRSLGERRALAVREALVAAGVDPNNVDTVSFGEDKPVDHGQNEAAYAANRRADFVVLTPP